MSKKTSKPARPKSKSIAKVQTDIEDAAILYHRQYPGGKLEISATKPLVASYDPSLAHSPGVAVASRRIVRDPEQSNTPTARGHPIGVVSNGSAVPGLGNIDPYAAQSVMEGKAVLFKKFAGLDAFDPEIKSNDVTEICAIVRSIE